MLYEFTGLTGTNGFVNGNVYRLIYEYVGGVLILQTPLKKLVFVCENEKVFRKNFRRVRK